MDVQNQLLIEFVFNYIFILYTQVFNLFNIEILKALFGVGQALLAILGYFIPYWRSLTGLCLSCLNQKFR